MGYMHLIPSIAFALVILSRALGASLSFPENNPQLGAYQNEESCFPLPDTYYMMYRNYKDDPYFGGDAKCITATMKGPFVDGSGTLTVQYGGNSTVNVRATILSSPGYTVKNVEEIETIGVPGILFNLTAVYIDRPMCKVLRHSYAENGHGCSLWRARKSLTDDLPCCEFVYALICGASPKYQVYDNCEESFS